jgi:hypothetical protein
MFAVLLATLSLSAGDWNKVDTAMMSVLVGESVYDVMNTRYRLLNPIEGLEDLPPKSHFEELNPLLGKHPSALRLWGSFAVAITAAIVICYFLPTTPRRLSEGFLVGAESLNLTHNALVPGHIVWSISF